MVMLAQASEDRPFSTLLAGLYTPLPLALVDLKALLAGDRLPVKLGGTVEEVLPEVTQVVLISLHQHRGFSSGSISVLHTHLQDCIIKCHVGSKILCKALSLSTKFSS